MSLLDDIRDDLVQEATSLSNTLRKAKLLARALSVHEFSGWVDSELNGYTDLEKLPPYRRFRPTNLGTFSGPFGSGVKNLQIPTYGLPETVKEFAEELVIPDSVGTLEGQGSNDHKRNWPPEMIIVARESIELKNGGVLVEAHQPIPGHVQLGIIDQVKNRLLDFVLGLEDHDISPDDLKSRSAKAEIVRNVFNIVINGDSNVLATGEQVNQVVSQVKRGDVESLIKHLEGLGIGLEDDDLEELRTALNAEPTDPFRGLGTQLQGWVGRMVEKAASGALRGGVSEASTKIMEALNTFTGL